MSPPPPWHHRGTAILAHANSRAAVYSSLSAVFTEFQLVQANDLAVVLGYEHHERQRLDKYNPCDIRVHFPTVGHN